MSAAKEVISLSPRSSTRRRRDLVLFAAAFVFLGWLTVTAQAQPPSPSAALPPHHAGQL